MRKPKTGEERRINLLSAKTLLLIKLDKLWTNALDINCPVPTGLQSQWKLIFYSMFTSKTQPELLRKSRYKYSTLIGPQCFSGQGHQQMAPAPPTTYVLCSSDNCYGHVSITYFGIILVFFYGKIPQKMCPTNTD